MHSKIVLSFYLLLMANIVIAQVPQQFNYQGVARDNSGVELANQAISLRISLHSGSPIGTAIYQETQSSITNQFGLFNLQIGSGTVVSGTFNTIPWGSNTYYVQVEMDATGGTNYTDMGTSQLLSVPYALYAETSSTSLAGPAGPEGPTGPQGLPGIGGCDPNHKDSLIVIFNNPTAYGFYQDANGDGHWLNQTLNNTNHLSVSTKNSVIIYDNATAYAFYRDNSGVGHWVTQDIGNTNHIAASTDKIAVIYNNPTGYAFYVNNSGVGTWVTQNIGNTNHNHIAHGDKIVVYNNPTAYSFSVNDSGIGTWLTEPIGNTNHTVVTTK